jgi:hypothetical protein
VRGGIGAVEAQLSNCILERAREHFDVLWTERLLGPKRLLDNHGDTPYVIMRWQGFAHEYTSDQAAALTHVNSDA